MAGLIIAALLSGQCLPVGAVDAELGRIAIVVVDGSSAVVPGARIELVGRAGPVKGETGQDGSFETASIGFGVYEIKAEATGFSPSKARIEITAKERKRTLKLVLKPMVHRERVEVSAAEEGDLAAGFGGPVLGERAIALLPDDPDQLRARLQLLATLSGGSQGNAAVQVDGFMAQTGIPSKSSIAEIRINPDQYSSQYQSQPLFGGGLIEIDTKPAFDGIHGGAGFTWSGSELGARPPLAETKAPFSNRIGSAELGLPILKNRLSSFTSFERKQLNELAVVVTDGLWGGRTVENVAQPQRYLAVSQRLDFQPSATEVAALRMTFESTGTERFGAGGIILPSASSQQAGQMGAVQLSLNSTLSATLLNQARIGVSTNREWLAPYTNEPAVLVAGGFLTGGSGSRYTKANRRTTELSDTVSWAKRTHTLRAGVQLLHFSTGQVQGAGFNGQYLFAGGTFNGEYLPGIEQYRQWTSGLAGVIPTVVQRTEGWPMVGLRQWQGAVFVQDEWKLRPRISLSLGLRYEAQTSPASFGNFAPRMGVAYSFGKKQEWVIRVRAGIFYRRIETATALEAARLGPGGQTDLIQKGQFAVLTQRSDLSGMKPGVLVQPQFTLERRIQGGTTVQAGSTLISGTRLPHSVGSLTAMGAQDKLNRLSFASTGASRGSLAMVNINSTAIRNLAFFGGYLFMNFKTNADSPAMMPQSGTYQASDWAMPAWQSAHRMYAGGVLRLPGKVEMTVLSARIAGNSFDLTTGMDNNGDGILNDRPAVAAALTPGAIASPYGFLNPLAINGDLPRNWGKLPPSFLLDSSVSRRFALSKRESSPSLTITLRGTNLTNHLNVNTVNGVVGSALFLQPTATDPARRIEAGVRFRF
jgi:hypothetical protein